MGLRNSPHASGVSPQVLYSVPPFSHRPAGKRRWRMVPTPGKNTRGYDADAHRSPSVRGVRRSVLAHAGEERDLVAGRVPEDAEPAGLRDLRLGYHNRAAEGLGLAQVGVDVVACHVGEHLARVGAPGL